MVITRFAPSPTGSLHIGSVRTILFNWLYAKHFNGKFLLRIEDTDVERSKTEHVDDILSTMKLLGLDWDDEIVFQMKNIQRHKDAVSQLLKEGKAYKCYCSQVELEAEREKATANKQTPKYSRKCRNLKENYDKPYTIRLKTEEEGVTSFCDLIQGECKVNNEHMDDMILLRSDGVPTYMLAVVVDDHDMAITHVIRGSEHLNNAYRQLQIYKAFNWKAPEFAHVSLIHAEDGSKLSKRTGATGLHEYLKKGFLKEAILNYLLRLGFSQGEEIISIEDCMKIFDIKNVRSSAARFSLDKLYSINGIYIKQMKNEDLLKKLKEYAESEKKEFWNNEGWQRILIGMDELKTRCRTLEELYDMSAIYGNRLLFGKTESEQDKKLIQEIIKSLTLYDKDISFFINDFIAEHSLKLKDLASLLRNSLTNLKVAPSIYNVFEILQKDIILERLKASIL